MGSKNLNEKIMECIFPPKSGQEPFADRGNLNDGGERMTAIEKYLAVENAH